jgi:hypothetical protein
MTLDEPVIQQLIQEALSWAKVPLNSATTTASSSNLYLPNRGLAGQQRNLQVNLYRANPYPLKSF